jgi:hypothetical protein
MYVHIYRASLRTYEPLGALHVQQRGSFHGARVLAAVIAIEALCNVLFDPFARDLSLHATLVGESVARSVALFELLRPVALFTFLGSRLREVPFRFAVSD